MGGRRLKNIKVDKSRVFFHLGRHSSLKQYLLESSSDERDLWVLVGSKVNMSQQCVMKINSIWTVKKKDK